MWGGLYTEFIHANNYRIPHFCAHSSACVPPPAGRHVGGVRVFTVTSRTVHAFLRGSALVHRQDSRESAHCRQSVGSGAHGDPGLTPAPHGSERPHHKALHVHSLACFCTAYIIVLNPMCLGLSHYFHMNETQLFSCGFWAYEFPLS